MVLEPEVLLGRQEVLEVVVPEVFEKVVVPEVFENPVVHLYTSRKCRWGNKGSLRLL